jgi:hypothetical protein
MTDFLLDFFEELMAATAIGLFVAFIAIWSALLSDGAPLW